MPWEEKMDCQPNNGRIDCDSLPSSRKVARNSRRIFYGPSQAIHLRPSRKTAGCFVDCPAIPGGWTRTWGTCDGQRGKRCIIRVFGEGFYFALNPNNADLHPMC
ncbi:hypothetical protein E2320_017876 [Naja naja]|nr:hypothetical protein E2320_017876 [Naja naja]